MSFIPCRLMTLEAALQIEAAKTAVRVNPVNAPLVMPYGEGTPLPPAEPLRLALSTQRTWGPKSRVITVGFMDQAPADLQKRVLSHMNAWNAWTCISFALSNVSPMVRIARVEEGYYSYLGTDILHIGANRQTMNLQGFTMATPESEFVRVVRHETGHTLGWPHEHMRQELVARIDADKAYAYFEQTQGWDAETVRDQVLTPLDPASLTTIRPADQLSIMCYHLPGSITKDGLPIVGGPDIDPWDQELAAKVYPRASAPPPPASSCTLTLSADLKAGTYTVPLPSRQQTDEVA